ncbi:MAG: hypothetical protein JEZ12_21270 [Desulfobacterium sp.]|nr:hypothetical protein [Desulfobacterium sp.]
MKIDKKAVANKHPGFIFSFIFLSFSLFLTMIEKSLNRARLSVGYLSFGRCCGDGIPGGVGPPGIELPGADSRVIRAKESENVFVFCLFGSG